MPAQPLNVLHLIADQHHAGLMGCAGHRQANTPHLDRLAREGVRFTAAYCQNPICSPSRLSILSGQYCSNHGYYGLCGPAPTQLPSVFGHFRAHGYRTAAIGKLHLPHAPRNWAAHDLDLFADVYETIEGEMGRSEFFDGLARDGLRELEDSWFMPDGHGGIYIPWDARPSRLPYERNVESWCVDQANTFIDTCWASHEPFFMQVAFARPHHTIAPDQRFWNLYPEDLDLPPTIDQDPSHRPPHFQAAWKEFRETHWHFGPPFDFRSGARRQWRGTLACISQVDDAVGRIIAHLDVSGQLENTIIIYGSDHGCYHGIHGIVEKAPGICSDAVCRVPFVWRVPGVASRVSDALVENIDIAPTVSALCGLPAMETVCGQDLSALLSGRVESVREMAVTENVWSKAVRWGRWRFVHYQPEMFPGQDIGELYDLEGDSDETCNLYADPAHQDTVHTLRRLLCEWLIRVQRPATVLPRMPVQPMLGRRNYTIAGDGREPRSLGANARHAARKLNYL